MSLIIADRIKETSTTAGLGDFTLDGAITGFRTFASVCTSPLDTCYYAVQAIDVSGTPTGDWEVGLATYSAANTLARTLVTASSNANAAVNFAAGTKQIWLNVDASQMWELVLVNSISQLNAAYTFGAL